MKGLEAVHAELDRWAGARATPEQWALIDRHIAAVGDYNKKVNLTADEGPALYRRHVADALAALPTVERNLPAQAKLADFGAGAGFVGIVLKIVRPQWDVTLIESSYRKFVFLNWISSQLGLPGLHVTQSAKSAFDAVLARAVAPLERTLELIAPLVKTGGAGLVFQSRPPGKGSGELLLEEVNSYRLPGEEADRALAVFRKRERQT